MIGLGIFFLGIGLTQGYVDYGLRRLLPRARVGGIVISAFGMLGFPVGTIVSAYLMYLLGSRKGKIVFSDYHRNLIEQTPQIKYKTSIIVKVLAFAVGVSEIILRARRLRFPSWIRLSYYAILVTLFMLPWLLGYGVRSASFGMAKMPVGSNVHRKTKTPIGAPRPRYSWQVASPQSLLPLVAATLRYPILAVRTIHSDTAAMPPKIHLPWFSHGNAGWIFFDCLRRMVEHSILTMASDPVQLCQPRRRDLTVGIDLTRHH